MNTYFTCPSCGWVNPLTHKYHRKCGNCQSDALRPRNVARIIEPVRVREDGGLPQLTRQLPDDPPKRYGRPRVDVHVSNARDSVVQTWNDGTPWG
jgi:hypothetical protein